MSDDLRDRLAAALSDKVERGATFSKLDAATDAVIAVFEAKLVAVIHGADDYGKELKAERDRYRLAWQSARRRASDNEEEVQRQYADCQQAERERAEALQAVAQACEDMAEFQRDMQKTQELLADSRRIMAGWDSIRAERDAALAILARVRELAAELDREHEEHRLDSDPLWMLAGLANADRLRAALAGPAGAGSTQDGAQ